MKVDFLHIKSRFKNLEDVRVDFDQSHLMTVVVGCNGTGKSNVLEALVCIFRNLDLGESPDFAFEIKYKLGNKNGEKWITVIADPSGKTPSQQYKIISSHTIDGKTQTIPLSKVKRSKEGKSDYLPNHVFAYYSGPSDRLEKHFKKHRTNFYRKLLKSQVDLKSDIRPLFYAKPFHSQFVLLAFFLSQQADQEKNFLAKHLGIEDLDSVHFVMRKPGWAQSKNRNELFWGAEGVVREFLELLFPHCMAPIKMTRSENVGLTGGDIKNEFFHLFLPNVDVLRKFASGLTPDVFFKMLESTLLSEIISEVSVRVKVTSSDHSLSFRELSEGEQQLLTVLGLLKFTGGRDTLFLLDEPDTHLNPAWTVKYLNFLDQFVPHSEVSHLLMVSHHPLAIAELQKEQVQVMKKVDGRIISFQPSESPRGMGINFLLRSDMFGLKTTIDLPTTMDIEERNKLASKPTALTASEKRELQRLSEQLDPLGFNLSTDDPDYMDYLVKKYHTEENIDK
ncbi:AAA family ATPase [Pseudophaeobacter sp.]|uniref:AAA family ATPase n=1 Tax=Pseudophaeobacter sp. TaxID=1971739 RepID=UPI003296DB4C